MTKQRKYVGARYVPLIMGEWDASATYEPLSVVLYNGRSYTSRTFVPAGIPLTNDVYWALSGDMSADVATERQQRIAADAALQSQIDEKLDKPTVTGANGQILTYQNGDNVWSDVGTPTDAQVGSAVSDWLDDHPEATTTVQDGSITNAKLVQTGGVLSEVEDIRTGYDGTVYSSAGGAVRGQISDIHKTNLESNIDISSPDQYYVTHQGRYVATDSDLVSIQFDVKKDETVELFGYGYNQLCSIITEKVGSGTANDPYKVLVLSIDNTQRKYVYTFDHDCTVIVTFRTKVGGVAVVNYVYKYVDIVSRLNEKEDISSYRTDMSYLVDRSNNLFDVSKAINNTSISSTTGAQSSNNDRWTTDFIPVSPGDKLISNSWFNAVTTICQYDSDKVFISNISSVVYPIELDSNASFIRAAFMKSSVPFEKAEDVFITKVGTVQPTYKTYTSAPTFSPMSIGYFDRAMLSGYENQNGLFDTSFSFFIPKGEESSKNVIIKCRAMYSGHDAPSIRFAYAPRYTSQEANQVFASIPYVIGANGKYVSKEWRMPPFPRFVENMTIKVDIPSGTTLDIMDFSVEYSNKIGHSGVGTRFNAHQGLIQLCIPDTLHSYNMAAQLGFGCCIAIPKRTLDGKWVCFHDDDEIGDAFLDENGDQLTQEQQEQPISAYTLEELNQWHYRGTGYYPLQRDQYGIERIATLEDFFLICAKTGMHPMLSCHPVPDENGFNEIKSLAKKFNLLPYLNIKMAPDGASLPGMQLAYSVFGDVIDSYQLDISSTTQYFVNEMSNIFDGTNARAGIEWFKSIIDEQRINDTISAGLFVACAELGRINASEYERLMKLGVTEFTCDYFTSVGLNW